MEAVPGDASRDGRIDVSDLGILAANYGRTTGATWDQGDFNRDGRIDVGDLGILAANYGTGSGEGLDFCHDAAALGLSVGRDETKTRIEEAAIPSIPGCFPPGLGLIAGLLLVGNLLMKVER